MGRYYTDKDERELLEAFRKRSMSDKAKTRTVPVSMLEQARAKISMLHRLCLTWVDKDEDNIPGVRKVILDLTRAIEQQDPTEADQRRIEQKEQEIGRKWDEKNKRIDRTIGEIAKQNIAQIRKQAEQEQEMVKKKITLEHAADMIEADAKLSREMCDSSKYSAEDGMEQAAGVLRKMAEDTFADTYPSSSIRVACERIAAGEDAAQVAKEHGWDADVFAPLNYGAELVRLKAMYGQGGQVMDFGDKYISRQRLMQLPMDARRAIMALSAELSVQARAATDKEDK